MATDTQTSLQLSEDEEKLINAVRNFTSKSDYGTIKASIVIRNGKAIHIEFSESDYRYRLE